MGFRTLCCILAVSQFSLEKVSCESTGTFRRETLLCCVSESFCDRNISWIGEAEVSRFSVEYFSSQSTEKLLRGTLLCFRKFLLSKHFMNRREGEEYHFFPSVFFCCLTVPKKFVRERSGLDYFRVLKVSGVRGVCH